MAKYYYATSIGYDEAGYDRIRIVVSHSLKDLKNKGYNSKLHWIRFNDMSSVKEYYSPDCTVVSLDDATI